MKFDWKVALLVLERVEKVMTDNNIHVHGLSGDQLAHVVGDALTTGKTVVEAAKDIKQDVQDPAAG